jgi:UDP-glucose 4-epimerase
MDSQVLVTGGAGFIGSHLVDALMNADAKVCVVDNLSAGYIQNIKRWLADSKFCFLNKDLTTPFDAIDDFSFDVIFHFAANPEVRVSSTHPQVHYQQNIQATYNLLEYIRKSGNHPTVVFASTSAVYGEPQQIPTAENYAPLKPISIYAATKLACEALITAYAYNYGFKAIHYRFANIIGPRSSHGIIYDFIQKLQKDPTTLEILGDGTQTKSYLHVTDTVAAILHGLDKSSSQVEIYNVGSEDKINVKTIADIVTAEMKLENVNLNLTGGVDGGRGWIGDVKIMLLDAAKIRSTGWKPTLNSQQAVVQTTRALLGHSEI